MNCKEAEMLISSKALEPDYSVSEEQAADFAAHINNCQDCRRAQEATARTLEVLSGLTGSTDEMAVRRRSNILAKGKAEIASPRKSSKLKTRLLAIAASAAAAAILVTVLQIWPDQKSTDDDAGNWRFVAGDSGNTRSSSVAITGQASKVAWEHRVRGQSGSYKPLLWNNILIVNAASHHKTHRGGGCLIAVDAKKGVRLWKRDFLSGDFHKENGFPDRCLLKGKLYITDGYDCLVLDAATGKTLSVISPPEEAGTWKFLTEHSGLLYGVSRSGRSLFCINPLSARIIWNTRIADTRLTIPAIENNVILASAQDGSLRAFSAADGRQLWKNSSASPSGKSRVLANSQHLLVISANDQLQAFAPTDGRFLWKRTVKQTYESGAALDSTSVYLLGGTLALNMKTGTTLWQEKDLDSGICSAPTLAGNILLSSAGKIPGSLAVRDRDGTVLFKLNNTARKACDGPLVTPGMIFTMGGGIIRAVSYRISG
jgi:outer membrane protein assembly factor BamB